MVGYPIVRNGLVIGIILLFVGTSAIPSMSGDIEKLNKNPSVSLDNGLEAYWSFNDRDNPGYDDSGNFHQGTVNGATWTSDGIKNGAMSFNGDGYISLPDFTSADSQGTMVVWVKQSLSSGETGLIYAEGDSSYNKPYIGLGFYGGQLYFARDVYGLSSNYQGKVDVGANDDKWHFVAFSSDGSTNHFYFDSQEVLLNWQDSNVPQGIWFDDQDTNTNSIGGCNRPDHWGFLNGTIDEPRIYNRALSQQEIKDLYTIFVTITGGFGINLIVLNKGTTDATDVQWQIHVTGGILGLIDITRSGTIDVIAPAESKTVGTGMFFGFGQIQMTYNVGLETGTVNGAQLFILAVIK
jgi:hypothetical protein